MSALAKAMCEVMRAVRYVPETGKNKFHGYSYASDEDLLSVLQPAMAEHGLSMIPTCIAINTVEHTPDAKGRAQWRTDLVVAYTLLHTSGETQVVQAPGCGLDGEDKGTYKAMTGALKYALRHMFLVPTGQDAERHAEEPQAKGKRGQNRSIDTTPSPGDQRLADEVAAERAAKAQADAARKATHHPSWTNAHKTFAADIAGMKLNVGIAMDAIGEGRGKRPSQMDNAERMDAIAWLRSNEGALVYDRLVSEREQA